MHAYMENAEDVRELILIAITLNNNASLNYHFAACLTLAIENTIVLVKSSKTGLTSG
jgi:hypothetical protein